MQSGRATKGAIGSSVASLLFTSREAGEIGEGFQRVGFDEIGVMGMGLIPIVASLQYMRGGPSAPTHPNLEQALTNLT